MRRGGFLRFIWRAVNGLFALVLTLSVAAIGYLYLAPTFGANPTGEELRRIEASPNYTDGHFANLIATQLDTRDPSESMNISSYLFPPEGKNPGTALPSITFDSSKLSPGSFAWLGHSTIVFKTDSLVVLADPVFNRASPLPVFGKPFPMQATPSLESLPEVDVVIISHDHYDHLDNRAITELSTSTSLFMVPLGVGAHLQRWGVAKNKIREFDWYQSETIDSTEFTFTPARHFSGRGITNRFKTLWGSWVIKSLTGSVFFSGDTGYFDELKKIGTVYGPFDIAFMENGAYNKGWKQIHMMPDESVQASMDLNSKVYVPIHWAKFDLAQHNWKDPIVRAVAKAKSLGTTITTPLIGEIFTLTELPQEVWWNEVKK